MARRGTLSFVLIAGALLGGCSSAAAPASDAGVMGDGAVALCGEPDRTCPAQTPFTSGPCAGELTCPYGSEEARCVGGLWDVMPLCDGVPPGGGCAPQLVESCDAPFAGTLAGASVTIGPFGEERAFTEGETVMPVFGAQGLAMVRLAIHVDGATPPPECVRARVTITFDGATEGVPFTQDVTLHCGDSLATLELLPDLPCESREYLLGMRVVLDGVGETSASLRMDGGGCPRTL